MKQETKTARIEARTSDAVRELIEQAALLQGRSISEFVVNMASEGARRTIDEHNRIKLSQRDQVEFAKSLLHPKPAPDSLKRAMQRHAELFGPS
jgi:uncharacterized protein (DUF1778 family)